MRGSIREARQAGKAQAISATTSSRVGTVAKVIRSNGDTPKRICSRYRLAKYESNSPILDKYGPLLADQRLRQLVAPLRTDGFSAMREGSEGVERIDVFVIKSSE